MRTLCTFLLALTVSFAFAQPTLTKNMKYDVGDSYSYYSSVDTVGLAATALVTGANFTWNLTLNIKDSSVFHFYDKTNTGSGSQFPDASWAWRRGWDTSFRFYQKTATELRYIAQENKGNPSSTVAAPYLPVVKWPFTYNDAYLDTASVFYTSTSKTTDLYFSKVANGYGTLIVNGKTYTNVLRTVTKYEEYNTGTATFSKSVEETEWWDEATKSPLLRIYCFRSPSLINPHYEMFILKKEIPAAIKGLNNLAANVSAHTQNGQLTLTGELETGMEYQLHLYNTAGQCIQSATFNAKGQQFSTPVPDMPQGIYYIHLQQRGDAPGYIKFLHQ